MDTIKKIQNSESAYAEIQAMLTRIAKQLAGPRASQDFIDELLSEGWLTVMETLPKYNETRGKITTFLWLPARGAMLRFAENKIKREKAITQEDEKTPNLSTENVPNSSVMFGNPYAMQPDTCYEKSERISIWNHVANTCKSDLNSLLQQTPKNQTLQARQSTSRNKKRRLSKLQAATKQLLLQKNTNSQNSPTSQRTDPPPQNIKNIHASQPKKTTNQTPSTTPGTPKYKSSK